MKERLDWIGLLLTQQPRICDIQYIVISIFQMKMVFLFFSCLIVYIYSFDKNFVFLVLRWITRKNHKITSGCVLSHILHVCIFFVYEYERKVKIITHKEQNTNKY